MAFQNEVVREVTGPSVLPTYYIWGLRSTGAPGFREESRLSPHCYGLRTVETDSFFMLKNFQRKKPRSDTVNKASTTSCIEVPACILWSLGASEASMVLVLECMRQGYMVKVVILLILFNICCNRGRKVDELVTLATPYSSRRNVLALCRGNPAGHEFLRGCSFGYKPGWVPSCGVHCQGPYLIDNVLVIRIVYCQLKCGGYVVTQCREIRTDRCKTHAL